ncbi:MAG: RHS repeat-associated core domain-containing protein [Planctomycetota bacterium]|nr:RHS repeat-associated core domain-containing protein [Planctomycetota bacterium]
MEALSTLIGEQIGDPNYDPDFDLDRSGAIDTSDFDVFGTQLGRVSVPGQLSDSTPDAVPPGPDNTIGFCGYVYSPQSQKYCVRFRWYEPTYGRWIERDPAGYGNNWYQYVDGTPHSATDPMGLYPMDSHLWDRYNDAQRQIRDHPEVPGNRAYTRVMESIAVSVLAAPAAVLSGPLVGSVAAAVGAPATFVSSLSALTTASALAGASAVSGYQTGIATYALATDLDPHSGSLLSNGQRTDFTVDATLGYLGLALTTVGGAAGGEITLVGGRGPCYGVGPGTALTRTPTPPPRLPGPTHPRFIADDAGNLVDMLATPPGRYMQPDRSATDILQQASHGGLDPFTARTHTHPAIVNQNPLNPAQGSTRLGDPRPVTTQEILNIMDGTAVPSEPRGR